MLFLEVNFRGGKKSCYVEAKNNPSRFLDTGPKPTNLKKTYFCNLSSKNTLYNSIYIRFYNIFNKILHFSFTFLIKVIPRYFVYGSSE